jgi:signal transduction histidine kinase
VFPAAHELRTPLTSVRGSANCTPRQLFPTSFDVPERRKNADPRRWEPAFGKEVRPARRQGQLLWGSPRCANRRD